MPKTKAATAAAAMAPTVLPMTTPPSSQRSRVQLEHLTSRPRQSVMPETPASAASSSPAGAAPSSARSSKRRSAARHSEAESAQQQEHDSQQQQTILNTPRKGRRMGGVQLGWGTPLLGHDDDDDEHDGAGSSGTSPRQQLQLPCTPTPGRTKRARSLSASAVSASGASSDNDDHDADSLAPVRFYTGARPRRAAAQQQQRAGAHTGSPAKRARGRHTRADEQQPQNPPPQRMTTKAALLDTRGWASAHALRFSHDAAAAAADAEDSHDEYHRSPSANRRHASGRASASGTRAPSFSHLHAHGHSEAEVNDLLEEYLIGFKAGDTSFGLSHAHGHAAADADASFRSMFEAWPADSNGPAQADASFGNSFSFSGNGNTSAAAPEDWFAHARHHLQREQQPAQQSKMVAVHIDGIGRVAVSRALAPAVLDGMSVSSIGSTAGGSSSSIASSAAARSASSSSSSGRSAGTATTATTALTAPLGAASDAQAKGKDAADGPAHQQAPASAATTFSGPSPSFSIASHFPASECGSPSLGRSARAHAQCPQQRDSDHQRASLREQRQAELDRITDPKQRIERHVATLQSVIARASSNSESKDASASEHQKAACCPPLTLHWPDSPTGPWSAAIEQANARRHERLQGVKAWLAGRSDDEDEQDDDERDEQDAIGFFLDDSTEAQQHQRNSSTAADADDGMLTASQQTVSDSLRVAPRNRRSSTTATGKARRSGAQPATPGAHSSDRQRHPMIAKALADRARKAALRDAEAAAIAAQSVGASAARAAAAAAKQAAKAQKATRKGKGSKRKRAGDADERYMALSTPLPLSRQDASAAFVGCFCGLAGETAPMVQCDTCERWYHMPCVGYQEDQSNAEDEWHCHGCIVRSSAKTTPLSSAYSGGLASVSTPSILRGQRYALPHLSQQRDGEPVFAQPGNSPLAPRSDVFAASASASALVLAPSPPMLSSAHPGQAGGAGGSGSRKSAAAGRARAERFGWPLNEPGSPLDRKVSISAPHTRAGVELFGTPVNARARVQVPGSASHAPQDAHAQAHAHAQALAAGLQRADWGQHARSASRNAENSPQLAFATIPARPAQRQSAQAAFAPAYRPVVESSDDESGVLNDIFSTPSRLDNGVWPGSATPRAVAQTPSRSARNRENSHGWALPAGLSTPGRDFLGGVFSTEHSAYSVGMPSLVYSSVGLEHRESIDKGDQSGRNWMLQSPSSSTRAARARGISNGLYSSSLLRTPELHRRSIGGSPTQPSVSSMRDTRRERESSSNVRSDLPSSSPLIKTPRTDDDDRRDQSGYLQNVSGIQTPASSKKLVRIVGMGREERKDSFVEPMGLGIGIDLDDDAFRF